MRLPLSLATLGAKGLLLLEAEQAHKATINLLQRGFAPDIPAVDNPQLAVKMAGLNFPNPLGLAAGFDKNAQVPDALLGLGFGFVEVGAVTPLAQAGNPSPRVFRLRSERAVINRYGFNNEGLAVIKQRLVARRGKLGIVGVNLGANKQSEDRTQDYVIGLQALEGLVEFCTINVSSPNTPGLRALQGQAALDALLARVMTAREALTHKMPVFLKIAPDLTDEDKADIAASALRHHIDGLIIANTTITRPDGLPQEQAAQTGGLSGAPLFALSTAVLRDFSGVLRERVPLIGVGGVFSARDAYRKILAGATLVQLYTALAYEGPALPGEILRGLKDFMAADGFNNITEAIGAEA